MAIRVEMYKDIWKEKWDKFVLETSRNGTFLQTRKFIEYHLEGRFKDCSLLFLKGNELVACILACEIEYEGKKCFFSHKGTSFGGFIVADGIYTASGISEMMDVFEEFLNQNKFESSYIKMTPAIFCRRKSELVDYFLYQHGYKEFSELNYYLTLDRYKDDIEGQFTANKRRDYRYSLKYNLRFEKLDTKDEIKEFYEVLQLNLKKLGLLSVHSYEDLLDLKYNRFNDKIEFYGVYLEEKMIAGSMIFEFDENVIHTQYLASNEEYLKLFPMDYLIRNLIATAVEKNKKIFTFGICTENQGRHLNLGLSRFKEGFGTDYTINRSYEKLLTR